MHRIALALIGTLCLASCGGDDGGSLTPAQFADEYAEAYCERAVACCTMDELADLGFGTTITDQASCENFFAGLLQAFLVTSIDASEQSGRAEFNASAAATCASTIRGLSCEQFARVLSEDFDDVTGCEAIITAKVSTGGACNQDYECTDGYCDGGSTNTEGTCGSLPGNGEPCEFECASGHYCEFGGMGSTCVPAKADGASCNSDDECQGACNGADPMMGTPGTCGTPMTCDGQ